jgi:hypothetical protein
MDFVGYYLFHVESILQLKRWKCYRRRRTARLHDHESTAPAGQPPRPPNPAPFAPPQSRALPLWTPPPHPPHPASPRDAATPPLSSTRAAADPFPLPVFSEIPALLPTPCASTPLQEEASRGLSPAQARRRSTSNAGAVTAVLRVAGGAREAGAPLLEGPDPEAGLGAGSTSVRYEGRATPAIGARRWSPWTPLFFPLSAESIMPPPRPSSSNIPSRRTSLLARAEDPICQDRNLLRYRPFPIHGFEFQCIFNPGRSR